MVSGRILMCQKLGQTSLHDWNKGRKRNKMEGSDSILCRWGEETWQWSNTEWRSRLSSFSFSKIWLNFKVWLKGVIFQFLWVTIQNIKPNHVNYCHVEGLQDQCIYARNKWVLEIDTWVETPCSWSMYCTEIDKKAWLFAKLQPGRARKRINTT